MDDIPYNPVENEEEIPSQEEIKNNSDNENNNSDENKIYNFEENPTKTVSSESQPTEDYNPPSTIVTTQIDQSKIEGGEELKENNIIYIPPT